MATARRVGLVGLECEFGLGDMLTWRLGRRLNLCLNSLALRSFLFLYR